MTDVPVPRSDTSPSRRLRGECLPLPASRGEGKLSREAERRHAEAAEGEALMEALAAGVGPGGA